MSDPDLNFTFHKNIHGDVRIYVGQGVSKNVLKVLDDLGPDKVFIICDSKIAQLYAQQVSSAVAKKYPAHIIVHKSDETNKSLRTVVSISEEFFIKRGTSQSVIIALGGGVTGNIAGFFASLVFRGIKLVHMPTTLLAQVDSAADVKQSVNSSALKNSLGSYKAPDAVIIDPNFLKSLDPRDLRAGLGEAVKHGFAQDMEFVNYILSCDTTDLDALQHIIKRSISLKIEHWKSTPTIWNEPNKVERLTHLGHTTGKILEMIQIDYLTHGEAIAHGMVIEAYMSHKLGYLDLKSVKKIHTVLSQLNLLYPLGTVYTVETIMSGLYDLNSPIFALLQGLGNPDTVSMLVPYRTALDALVWYFKTYVR